MTKAEICLWKYVLRGKMTGYTFNRQRPVLNYIVDFMCKPLKLIIEVDGITHLDPKVAIKDVLRQKALESVGFVVIRFKDEEVLGQIESVRDHVLRAMELQKETLPLTPSEKRNPPPFPPQ
jgi:very-short-patch-repair endonuclease